MTPPTDWPTPARPAVGARAEDGVRIGDAERERAVTDLGEHYAAGRLDRDELDERLELAWRARTAVDLRPLFADLPSGGTPRAVTVRPRNADVVRRRGLRGGLPFGFPPPVLLLIALAIVLTIVTHMPFVLFFLWWLFMGGFFRGGGAARGANRWRRRSGAP